MIHSHICLVCGYKGLDEAPYDILGNCSYEICSCCGFQFGVDDDDYDENGTMLTSKEELHTTYRKSWISTGAKAFSDYYPKKWLNRDGSLKDSVLTAQFENIVI